jgi:hypothetical protein
MHLMLSLLTALTRILAPELFLEECATASSLVSPVIPSSILFGYLLLTLKFRSFKKNGSNTFKISTNIEKKPTRKPWNDWTRKRRRERRVIRRERWALETWS